MWNPGPIVRTLGDVDDNERIGRRIATARKSLGMTQLQLADRANVSKSMLAKVESGHASASNVWVGSVAKALGVDIGFLSGQPYTSGSAGQAAVHQLIPPVRRTLASWDLIDLPHDIQPIPLDDLAFEVEQLHIWRHKAAYDQMGAALPSVLTHLIIAAKTATTDTDRARAYSLLTMAYRAANTIAHKLGYTDLSLTALDRMEWAASQSADTLLVAIVDYVRAGALGRIGEHEGALRLLSRAMTSVEEAAKIDPTARAVLGCLHMKSVVIYGTMADAGRVYDHLQEASQIATGSRDRLVYETVFGPANVALHALSAQVDLCDPAKALGVADSVRLPPEMAKERMTYFYIDLARARLLNNEPDKAIDALYEARSIAPIHFANSASVRGTIQSIASRQRRANGGLRALAHAAGIQD